MKRVRRNAFAVDKKGAINPETLSADYPQDEVFDMVPSSEEVDLRSDEEDDENPRSSTSTHLTEEQVQGIKMTLSTSSRANISMGFLIIKIPQSSAGMFALASSIACSRS